MVGRPGLGARVLVDPDMPQPVGGARRQQQVVDADTVVALPGAVLVVPEAERLLVRVQGAEGVGQAQVAQAPPGPPALGAEERVVGPARRIAHVDGLGDHVVVATQDGRDPVLEQRRRVRAQAPHPRQLVGEPVGPRRVAVGQVDGGHPQPADDALDVAGLRVGVIPGQAAAHRLDAGPRQDGDPVIALLPVRLDLVAQGLDLEVREGVVGALGLLQEHDVGHDAAQPGTQDGHPGVDRVDVPGGDHRHGYGLTPRDRSGGRAPGPGRWVPHP